MQKARPARRGEREVIATAAETTTSTGTAEVPRIEHAARVPSSVVDVS
jgi:hypothetical protein